MLKLLPSKASNCLPKGRVSGGPLCDVKTCQRTSGDRSSGAAFSEELWIQYINADRTCSLQIQQNGRGGCVKEVLVKLNDNEHCSLNNTKADMVASRDDRNADISCQITRLSGNIVCEEFFGRQFFIYTNSHGHGAFSHRRSSSSSSSLSFSSDSYMMIVEHFYVNKEADTGIHLGVEIRQMSKGSLDVKVKGPEEGSLSAVLKRFKKGMMARKLIEASVVQACWRFRPFDFIFPRRYSPFKLGGSRNVLRGRNLIVIAPMLNFSSQTPSFSNDISNVRQDTRGLVTSSGTAIGDGNGSMFFYHCLFGNFD